MLRRGCGETGVVVGKNYRLQDIQLSKNDERLWPDFAPSALRRGSLRVKDCLACLAEARFAWLSFQARRPRGEGWRIPGSNR